MDKIQLNTRVDRDLYEAFEREMKLRGQDRAQLLRTFIRDGVARYDSASEQILQTQEAILENVKKLQEMVGAVLHLKVENDVRGLPKLPNETPETYMERVRGEYRTSVFSALDKGSLIAAGAAAKGSGRRTHRDR